MADISKIKTPDGTTYNVKASKLEFSAIGIIGGNMPIVLTNGSAGGEVTYTDSAETGVSDDGYLVSKSVKLPDVYSSTGHIVGYWIDGSPIYEKTVSYSATISSGGNVTVPTATWSQKGQPIDLTLYYTSGNNKIVYKFVAAQINSSGVLQIFNGRAANLAFDTFTIQYVKIT